MWSVCVWIGSNCTNSVPTGRVPSSAMVGQEHRGCAVVDLFPFGRTTSCAVNILQQLVRDCQRYIPSISLQVLSNPGNIDQMVSQCLGKQFDECFYTSRHLRIKQLHAVLNILANLPDIENRLTPCLDHHC